MKTLLKFVRFFHSPDGDGGAGGGGGDAGAGGGGQGGDAGAAGGTGGGGTPPAFDIRQHLADDGSFKPDWWKAAGVSEAYGKKFTRPEAAFRSGVTLETQIGKKGVIVPGPNATKEERDAFATALGRPAKPEEYGFAKPEKITLNGKEVAVPDHAWDANRAKNWQAKLYEMGVPKETAQKIMAAAVEESVTGLDMIQQGQTQHMEAARTALKKEWGADYDANMAAAQRAAAQFGGDELKNHPALGSDPVLIKALANIAKATAERPGVNTKLQGGHDALTPAEARVQADKLTQTIQTRTRENRQWATTPEAAAMKAEKSRLYQIAHPN